MYLNIAHDHTRGFTQQWFVIIMLVYSTEQILFRKDPWEDVTVKGDRFSVMGDGLPEKTIEADREKLEAWMAAEKPYLNPEFKLMDLRAVLPMNRTYLSQLINSTYGCSFYQFVNRYRIEEAKRLMQDHPEMKVGEIASRAGFSSREVFTRTFSNMTGMAPGEWRRECNNS